MKEWLHPEELGYVLLVIGVLYVVGTDLLRETFAKHLTSTSEAFLREVQGGTSSVAEKVADGFARVTRAVATGSSELRKETALAWVRSEGADRDALREVARVAYGRSYGHADCQDFCESMEAVLLDRSMAPRKVYRRNQVTRVFLVKTGAPAGMLGWEEETSFDLVANLSAGPFDYTIRRGSRFSVSEPDVVWVLQNCRYTISVGGSLVAQFAAPSELTVEALRAPSGWSSPDGTSRMWYDGRTAKIEVEAKIRLDEKKVLPVHTYENSYFSADERFYTLSCKEPVRNFNLSFNVEREYLRLENAVLGPGRYWDGNDLEGYAHQTGWPDTDRDHYCNVQVPTWVLPGVVLAMNWRPRSGATTSVNGGASS
ncbi:MAG TPA: hypothetical protein VFH27_17615 [Longimicrobiaceae bacterium]|nr:hypothetical protein [Longimicrobiaceae bacterium]